MPKDETYIADFDSVNEHKCRITVLLHLLRNICVILMNRNWSDVFLGGVNFQEIEVILMLTWLVWKQAKLDQELSVFGHTELIQCPVKKLPLAINGF